MTLESLFREQHEAVARANQGQRRLLVRSVWARFEPLAVPLLGHLGAAVGFGQVAEVLATVAEPMAAAKLVPAIPAALAMATAAVAEPLGASSSAFVTAARAATLVLGATVLLSQAVAGPAGVAAAMMGASGAMACLSSLRACLALLSHARGPGAEKQEALNKEILAHHRRALTLGTQVEQLEPKVKALKAAFEAPPAEAPDFTKPPSA